MKISKDKKIAIIAGNRLGDGLIIQLICYNLYLNGYDITLFNTPLLTLKNWFSWAKIKPFFNEKDSNEHLKDFDVLIYQHKSRHFKESEKLNKETHVLYGDKLFMQRKSLVDIYFQYCQNVLKLEKLNRSNGVEINPSLKHRKNKKRIIIHPSSLRPEKNWPKDKFVLLAKKLKSLGYQPIFTVSPPEKQEWSFLEKDGQQLIIFEKLNDLASYIYESGYMIGNDSGIAHLTSSINIPALALFIRRGVAARWRPNFLPATAVLPLIKLPGPKLQEKFWKKLLSVNRVVKKFKKTTLSFP